VYFMDCKLIMTIDEMQDRQAWLQARKHSIGGSEAGIIAGLNPWKSPYELWLEKTGQAEPPALEDNERIYWGNVLEDTVAKEFTKRTGKKVQRRGLMQSNAYPFITASVDRLVTGEPAGLECKTTSAYNVKQWADGQTPPSYYCQCQHYMLVTGAPYWYIAVLIGGQQYEYRKIERDNEDIAALLEMEQDFWQHVTDRTPPAIDGTDSCTNAIREKFKGGNAEPVTLPSTAAALIESYDALKQAEKDAKAQRQKVENELCTMLGDNESGYIGERLISWKSHAGRITLDTKQLKSDLPDIYEKYAKEGKPYRTFKA
jgi:putative phage-type endonuclease